MPDNIHDNRPGFQPDLFETESLDSDNRRQIDYAVMYCDGASSGNPGKSGIGVVIDLIHKGASREDEPETYRISEYIGIATNNVAEYSALLTGLIKARSLGVKKINVFLDSELLVRQINGIYKVKNKNLIPLWEQAINMLKDFDDYKVIHVRREMNKEADSLARQAVKKNAGG